MILCLITVYIRGLGQSVNSLFPEDSGIWSYSGDVSLNTANFYFKNQPIPCLLSWNHFVFFSQMSFYQKSKCFPLNDLKVFPSIHAVTQIGWSTTAKIGLGLGIHTRWESFVFSLNSQEVSSFKVPWGISFPEEPFLSSFDSWQEFSVIQDTYPIGTKFFIRGSFFQPNPLTYTGILAALSYDSWVFHLGLGAFSFYLKPLTLKGVFPIVMISKKYN